MSVSPSGSSEIQNPFFPFCPAGERRMKCFPGGGEGCVQAGWGAGVGSVPWVAAAQGWPCHQRGPEGGVGGSVSSWHHGIPSGAP